MIQLIRAGGGVPCLAHPFEPLLEHQLLLKIPCIEIYSAYSEGMKEQGNAYFTTRDRRRVMLDNWDRLLRENPLVVGIAVESPLRARLPSVRQSLAGNAGQREVRALRRRVHLAGVRERL